MLSRTCIGRPAAAASLLGGMISLPEVILPSRCGGTLVFVRKAGVAGKKVEVGRRWLLRQQGAQ